MKSMKPELLATIKRGSTIEVLHYGWICVLNKDNKIVYKKGNISNLVFLRSSLKPIQAIPIIENNIGISSKELAIVCGSHSGSKKHLAVLNNFMKKHKLHILDLRCGVHLPLDEGERNRLSVKNISPSLLHNNCSGKHLGMLAVCKKNNWDLKTYSNPNHPLQKAILKNMQKLSCAKKMTIAVDGCGVPTFAMPLINIAKMFSNFTSGANRRHSKIISSMTKNPEFVGGKDQIDSEIMKCSKGRLLAKVGAEGIIVVAYKGSCAVVKIADGSPRARSFVILKLLRKLNWLKESEIKNSILHEILKGKIKNHARKVVGEIKTVF